jgi:hypothetical protein
VRYIPVGNMLQIDVNTEKKHRQWRVSSYIYRIINSIFPASLVVENFQPLSDLFSLMSRKDNELNFSVVKFFASDGEDICDGKTGFLS